MDGSIYMPDDLTSFSWAVDNAIRSDQSESNLGESPIHSFSSVVNSAIRSSSGGEADLVTSPVHTNASTVDIRTVAARLSQVLLNATGYFAAPLITVTKLKAATNNFSLDNKIGVGSFGVVYRAVLADGRELVIKRNDRKYSNPKFIPTESVFSFLSRLHHKNLVGLIGLFCEKGERLLVYEYMKNGSLYDHLHGNKGNSVLNCWKRRIKIALDISRGIEYLHCYTVPSIIHRNINSTNIFLDSTWTAKISDYEDIVICAEADGEYEEPVMGTLGYIDPEYLHRGVVTAKSDVFGFGVLLLELLTGKRAIFVSGKKGASVVDFAVPYISAGNLVKVLDPRVGPPDVNEVKALELMAFVAMHCVNLEGKDRPTMFDIVVNLEKALAICVSISSVISQ